MKPEFSKVKKDYTNLEFAMLLNGFYGHFRIVYRDESRANARYKTLRATDAYFVQLPRTTDEQFSNSYRIENTTDAMLFVERKKQWILETIIEKEEEPS